VRKSAHIAAANQQDATSGCHHNEPVTARRFSGVPAVVLGAAGLLAVVIGSAVGHQLVRGLATAPLPGAYYATGVIAFGQRPEQRAARRMLGFGVTLSVAFGFGYAYSAVVDRGGVPSWSGAAVVVLLALNYAAGVAPLALFAVFPNGDYERGYERRLVRLAYLSLPVLLIALCATEPKLHVNVPYTWLPGEFVGSNPVAIVHAPVVAAVAAGLLAAGQLWSLLGVIVLVLRYRRAAADIRRQIAWPLYALSLSVLGLAVLGSRSGQIEHRPVWQGYLLYYPVLLLIPAGLLIGMLRHRVLDVNLVVRRSAVYGALWLLIAAAYTAVAVGLGLAAARQIPLDVALVLTILATVIATPLRRRLERWADRLVFGPRSPGYELLSDLGDRLEASLAPDETADAVAAGVREGLDANWVRVTVQGRARPLASVGIEDDARAEPVLIVPLVISDDAIGALECGPRREGAYRPADEELLQTLGRQAALGLRSAQLSMELSDRLADLAASRARLVRAEEEGRRRLERDLHDGVQQELVALLAHLSMARQQVRRTGDITDATLARIQADARHTLESLQDLVRGIHPAVLTDSGLLDAVTEQVTRLPLAASISTDGLRGNRRFPPDIEAAAYFFVSEALTNVLKHAQASRAWISFQVHPDGLHISVRDDGRGFVVDETHVSGLRGLADRVEALGGCIDLTTHPGRGTTVTATLPIEAIVHA
jgi:signal transduction histidine kinase